MKNCFKFYATCLTLCISSSLPAVDVCGPKAFFKLAAESRLDHALKDNIALNSEILGLMGLKEIMENEDSSRPFDQKLLDTTITHLIELTTKEAKKEDRQKLSTLFRQYKDIASAVNQFKIQMDGQIRHAALRVKIHELLKVVVNIGERSELLDIPNNKAKAVSIPSLEKLPGWMKNNLKDTPQEDNLLSEICYLLFEGEVPLWKKVNYEQLKTLLKKYHLTKVSKNNTPNAYTGFLFLKEDIKNAKKNKPKLYLIQETINELALLMAHEDPARRAEKYLKDYNSRARPEERKQQLGQIILNFLQIPPGIEGLSERVDQIRKIKLDYLGNKPLPFDIEDLVFLLEEYSEIPFSPTSAHLILNELYKQTHETGAHKDDTYNLSHIFTDTQQIIENYYYNELFTRPIVFLTELEYQKMAMVSSDALVLEMLKSQIFNDVHGAFLRWDHMDPGYVAYLLERLKHFYNLKANIPINDPILVLKSYINVTPRLEKALNHILSERAKSQTKVYGSTPTIESLSKLSKIDTIMLADSKHAEEIFFEIYTKEFSNKPDDFTFTNISNLEIKTSHGDTLKAGNLLILLKTHYNQKDNRLAFAFLEKRIRTNFVHKDTGEAKELEALKGVRPQDVKAHLESTFIEIFDTYFKGKTRISTEEVGALKFKFDGKIITGHYLLDILMTERTSSRSRVNAGPSQILNQILKDHLLAQEKISRKISVEGMPLVVDSVSLHNDIEKIILEIFKKNYGKVSAISQFRNSYFGNKEAKNAEFIISGEQLERIFNEKLKRNGQIDDGKLLQRFLRDHEEEIIEPPSPLPIHYETVTVSYLPSSKEEIKAQIEDLVIKVIQNQYKNRMLTMIDILFSTLKLQSIHGKPSEAITGEELRRILYFKLEKNPLKNPSEAVLSHFFRKFLSENKEKFRPPPPSTEETILNSYSIADSRPEIIGLMKEFISNPVALVELLQTHHSKSFDKKSISDFVKKYVGLIAEEGDKGKIEPSKNSKTNNFSAQKTYLQSLMHAVQRQEFLKTNEGQIEEQVELLIKISRLDFQKNPQGLIDALTEQLKEIHGNDFVRTVYERAIAKLKNDRLYVMPVMKIPPFPYQPEAVKFLASRRYAILADEVGLGKTYEGIAGCEAVKAKKILWVTTSSNKGAVEREINTVSNNDPNSVLILKSGDVEGRRRQLENLDGKKYIITNFETLSEIRGKEETPSELYKKLQEELDVVIIDEAHLADNPESLRSQAVRGIEAKHKWLLSATPYQNRVEGLWTLLNYLFPKKFESREHFIEKYCKDDAGLRLLHSELRDVMLRRTKEETLLHFEDPATSGKSFFEQLANGMGRIPQKVRVDPSANGHYSLLPEQTEIIARMTHDFSSYAKEFNALHGKKLPENGITPLQKFFYIHKVIYEPEFFGIKEENPLFKQLDKTVNEKLARGEKVIVWAWNKEMIHQLAERYGSHGLRVVNSEVKGNARDEAVIAFQNDPNCKILIANYKSGGVGLTLTAATTAVFAQLPLNFQGLYQSEGRHHRAVGAKAVDKAKTEVYVEWAVPKFDEATLKRIENPELLEILEHGTLVEQTFDRLQGGELIYKLVMEGFGNPEDVRDYFRNGLLTGMGLTKDKSNVSTASKFKTKRAYEDLAKVLLPMWEKNSDQKTQDRILQLVHAMAKNAEYSKPVAKAIEAKEIDSVLNLYEIRSKYIRDQIFKRLPSILKSLHEKGSSLAKAAENLKVDSLTATEFLGNLLLKGKPAKLTSEIANELSHMKINAHTKQLEEDFYIGLLGIQETLGERVLENNEKGWLEGSTEQKIHALNLLGQIAKTHPESLQNLLVPYSSFSVLNHKIEQAALASLAHTSNSKIEDVQKWSEQNTLSKETVKNLLALASGYGEHRDPKVIQQYREALHHLFKGDFIVWRNNRAKSSGNAITYLSDQPEFWNVLSKNISHTHAGKQLGFEEQAKSLRSNLELLVTRFKEEPFPEEGPFVKEAFKTYCDLNQANRNKWLTEYSSDAEILGKWMSSKEGAAPSLLKKYGLPKEKDIASVSQLRLKKQELDNLIHWIKIQESLDGNLSDGAIQKNLKDALKRKETFYRRNQSRLADDIGQLREHLNKTSESAVQSSDFKIEETDSPEMLARMGALSPEMVNCLNPNGNPEFTQFVTGLLGSPNMKLLVAKDNNGKILAFSLMKVKKLEDGSPVLFLERGMSVGPYDYRKEMFGLLKEKAKEFKAKGINVKIMDQIVDKAIDSDPIVFGTGAYTDSEYVEPVYKLRNSNSVRHRGRLVP